MAALNVTNDANAITSVFLPITVSYAWALPLCTVIDSNGNAAIDISINFANETEVGRFMQILNGSYRGSYKVLQLISGSSLVVVLDTPFTGVDNLSNRFNPDKKQAFELFAGYKTGTGSSVKPYKKIADISVSINPTSLLFDVDVARYLRSYFEINDPIVGKDYGISTQWELFRVGDSTPTTSTITWELDVQTAPHDIDGGITIDQNNAKQVAQRGADFNGSFTAPSGDVIQVKTQMRTSLLDAGEDNAIRLTIVDDQSVTTFQKAEAITDYAPNGVGIIFYTFTILPNRSYTITVETASSF